MTYARTDLCKRPNAQRAIRLDPRRTNVIPPSGTSTPSVASKLVAPDPVWVIITSCDKEYGNGRNSLPDNCEPENGVVSNDCEVRPKYCENSASSPESSSYVLYVTEPTVVPPIVARKLPLVAPRPTSPNHTYRVYEGVIAGLTRG